MIVLSFSARQKQLPQAPAPEFDEVEMREITVQRTFPDLEDFWTISLSSPNMRSVITAISPNDVELLKTRVRVRLPADATGRITYSARANAVKGRVPK